jgi:L-seryl-tRNA(Ser) seleniumtransferase
MASKLKDLPQIQHLLSQPLISVLINRYSHTETVSALRNVMNLLRERILANTDLNFPDFASSEFAAQISEAIQTGRKLSL